MKTTLGARLKALRIKNKETVDYLAESVQVAQSTVSKWEHDEVIPRDEKVKRLAKHYNVSFEWLRLGVNYTSIIPSNDEDIVSIRSFANGNETRFFDVRILPVGHSDRLVYIQVEGSEMGDVFPSGSLLIVDLEDRHYKDEKIYVFNTHDFLSIRKLLFTSTGVRLQPLGSNRDEPLTFQQLSKLDLVGRVITSQCPR
ncbi:hypothetical protein JCM19232_4999 [Vibrio ishigakensis]|uniref:HTH cro/C1-type domain-containing protein n=1 Tax=Vibrio ishigakensis TaxID=1481914 RepID=A0A0B8PS86_9VIBR|nr:hypothetical protein JCM19232_4999 [Vibrio ishigakensis]